MPSLVQTWWGGADLLQEGDGAWAGPGGEGRSQALTWSFQVLAELGLGLTVGPEAALLRELVGHGGGGDDGFEAALALGHVLLRVEEDDVDLGHVEHPQGHRGAQTHRDRQRRRLDVQLGAGRGRCQGGLRPGLSGALSEAHALDRHSGVQTRGPPCVPLASGRRELWYRAGTLDQNPWIQPGSPLSLCGLGQVTSLGLSFLGYNMGVIILALSS